jgi:hypothetical protein
MTHVGFAQLDHAEEGGVLFKNVFSIADRMCSPHLGFAQLDHAKVGRGLLQRRHIEISCPLYNNLDPCPLPQHLTSQGDVKRRYMTSLL